MEIKDMSVEQVMALAYKEGRKASIAQQNLQILNQRIQELENEASKVPAVPSDTNDK